MGTCFPVNPLGGCGCTLFKACENLVNCGQFNCCTTPAPGSSDAVAYQSTIWRQCQLKKAIKRSLVSRCKKTRLPVLTYLEETYAPIEKYTKLELQHENQNEKGTIIELQNIFDNIDNKVPKRILIESQPGFGKTTLAHKIVCDWVKKEKYVGRFKFAILVILRSLQATTLQERLAEILKIDNYDIKEIWNAVNNEKTLFVLDGWDEVGEDARQNILEILHDMTDKYKMTIVVTCRIGLLQLRKEESMAMNHGVAADEEFCSKKITILGITKKNRKEFLRHFVHPGDNYDAIMTRIQEIIETREKMFESPLLLILLVHVLRDNYKVKIKTNTDLYYNLVNCIIRRSVDRQHPKTQNAKLTLLDENKVLLYEKNALFDEKNALLDEKKALLDEKKALLDENKVLFDENKALLDEKIALLDEKIALLDEKKALLDEKKALFDENKAFIDENEALFDKKKALFDENEALFYTFGKMAIDHIVKNKFQFGADDKTEAIHQLGFLTKYQTEKNEVPIIQYEGFHLSILEFAAAFFMSEEFRKNDNKLPPELIEIINELCKTKKSTSLVIPFLCGLLRHNVSKLFEQLSPNRVLYWINQDLIEMMIDECEIDDSFGNSFKRIAPPHFYADTIRAISTINHKELRNCFENVIIDSSYIRELTHPIEVSTIIIEVSSNSIYNNNPKQLENFAKYLKCNTLHLVLQYDLSYDITAANISLFNHVCCKRKNLQIYFNSETTCNNIEKCVENGVLIGKEIDNLRIIYKHHEEPKAIVQILENNRVNHLMLRDVKLTDTILDLIYATPKSSDLKSLWIAISPGYVVKSPGYVVTSPVLYHVIPGSAVTFSGSIVTSPDNDGFCLDLDKITKSGAKEWDLLRFQNVRVECNNGKSLKKSNCIKSLSITDYDQHENQSKLVDDNLNIILSTTPSTLRCNFSVFQALCTDTNADSWKGWETIEYLILSINHDGVNWDADDLLNFSRFKKLSSLTCDILIQLDEPAQSKLSESFKFLKLARLEISGIDFYYYVNVFTGIIDLIVRNQIPEIKEVLFSIIISSFSPLYIHFNTIKFECIQCVLQSVDRISFRLISYNWDVMMKTIFNTNILELWGLEVKYSFVEIGPKDATDFEIDAVHLRENNSTHFEFNPKRMWRYEGQHVFELKLK